MNVKMSEDIVKFLVVVGACTAGVLAYNWYSEKEKQKLKNLENQPKPNNRKIEKVEEDVSNQEIYEGYDEMSFISKVMLLVNRNTNIDKDDLDYSGLLEVDTLDYGQIRIECCEDNDQLDMMIVLHQNVKKSKEIVDGVIDSIKGTYEVRPYIQNKGYRVVSEGVAAEDTTLNICPVQYRTFAELGKKVKSEDDVYAITEVSFKLRYITPEIIADFIEQLINNECYDAGFRFGPVTYCEY